MGTLRRIRRTLKWLGVAMSAMLVCANLASAFWSVTWCGKRKTFAFGLSMGLAGVCLADGPALSLSKPGWQLQDAPGRYQWWRFDYLLNSANVHFYIVVPLWMPLMLIALPTTILIYLDHRRRIPPGHCRHCGYNLTGNVSGICPECGRPT